MQLSDALRAFWPVFAAVPLFLILGFWWRFSAARAMEQSPKPYTWVRQYRTGGFPFRRKLMGAPKLRVWILLAVPAVALVFLSCNIRRVPKMRKFGKKAGNS